MLTRGRRTLLITPVAALAVALSPATALAGSGDKTQTYGKKSATPGTDHGGKPAGGGSGRRIR
jgi:hypothetical protein